jgi:hypothetical protein
MMFFKSVLSLSALLVLVSSMTLERNGKSYKELARNNHSHDSSRSLRDYYLR